MPLSELVAPLSDLSLYLLRLMLGALFATSGWSHLTRPVERGQSIGLPPGLTRVVGLAEIVGAASLVLGLYAQVGAVLLIGVMLGAIRKKIFVWKTGFWGERGQGWFHDLLYLVCNLVIVGTGGGAIAITRPLF